MTIFFGQIEMECLCTKSLETFEEKCSHRDEINSLEKLKKQAAHTRNKEDWLYARNIPKYRTS